MHNLPNCPTTFPKIPGDLTPTASPLEDKKSCQQPANHETARAKDLNNESWQKSFYN